MRITEWNLKLNVLRIKLGYLFRLRNKNNACAVLFIFIFRQSIFYYHKVFLYWFLILYFGYSNSVTKSLKLRKSISNENTEVDCWQVVAVHYLIGELVIIRVTAPLTALASITPLTIIASISPLTITASIAPLTITASIAPLTTIMAPIAPLTATMASMMLVARVPASERSAKSFSPFIYESSFII